MLVKFREGLIPLPLVPEIAWVIDEAAAAVHPVLPHQGQGDEDRDPDDNRPSYLSQHVIR